jgi:hypothetical protein
MFSALTRAAQQLALEWGVEPVMIPECRDVEDLWALWTAGDKRDGFFGRRLGFGLQAARVEMEPAV